MTYPQRARLCAFTLYPCLVLLLGCPGSASDGIAPVEAGCDYSGAFAGSTPCTVFSVIWEESTDTTLAQGIHVATGTGEPQPLVYFDFVVDGQPTKGDFIGGKGGAQCSASVFKESGGPSWGAMSQEPSSGACSFSVTSVTMLDEQTVEKNGEPSLLRTYELHGALSATLEPVQNDAQGEVDFEAVF